MRSYLVAGYLVTASLYLLAWFRPDAGYGRALLDWVSFTKLPLTEFLTLHAATSLAAFVMATHAEPNRPEFRTIFWVVSAFYGLLAIGAYFFHGNKRALVGFYALILIRTGQLFSLGSGDADTMRSEVLKNFAMTVPMMLLVAGISTADDMLTPWQESFLKSRTLWRRIWRGRAILFAVAYYLLWAFVELKWPERITDAQ